MLTHVTINEAAFSELEDFAQQSVAYDMTVHDVAFGQEVVVVREVPDGPWDRAHLEIRAKARARSFLIPKSIAVPVGIDLGDDLASGIDELKGSGETLAGALRKVRAIWAALPALALAVNLGCVMIDVETIVDIPDGSGVPMPGSPLVWTDVTAVAGSTEDVPEILGSAGDALVPGGDDDDSLIGAIAP